MKLQFTNTFLFIFIYSILFSSSVFSEKCIDFSSPKQGTILNTAQCTLQVESICNNIKNIEFQARYFALDSDTPTIISLGTINRPPYKLIWDISQIPNQLIDGVAFLAEATLNDGSTDAVRREGVFFTHHPIEPIIKIFPYEFSGTKTFLEDTIALTAARSAVSITSSLYWNEKEVSILVAVHDPLFYVNLKRDMLANLGVEILIDPGVSRKPFPSKDILIYDIPLYGKPIKRSFKPTFDDSGSFILTQKTIPCEFEATITKEDFKGFKILFPIPLKEFSDKIPEKFSFNLIVKTLDEKNEIVPTSWIKSSSINSFYSPYTWGTIQLASKPIYKSRILVWSISFVIGLLLIMSIFHIITLIRHRQPQQLSKFERSEVEQQQFDKIKEIIEAKVTYNKVDIEKVASELRIPAKKLNTLVRKYTGFTFNNYLMFCRTEIAKERLRSSHCSEASIAETCGFSSVNELEKYFLRFHHTTPYKFRTEQQVA